MSHSSGSSLKNPRFGGGGVPGYIFSLLFAIALKHFFILIVFCPYKLPNVSTVLAPDKSSYLS